MNTLTQFILKKFKHFQELKFNCMVKWANGRNGKEHKLIQVLIILLFSTFHVFFLFMLHILVQIEWELIKFYMYVLSCYCGWLREWSSCGRSFKFMRESKFCGTDTFSMLKLQWRFLNFIISIVIWCIIAHPTFKVPHDFPNAMKMK